MSSKDFNDFFRLAAGFVQHTGRHVFLTGKAGTGKTTFLKYLKENTLKNIAIVAPTGVAAINAGGVTMHSFFQLPMGLYLPTRQYAYHEGQGDVTTELSLFRNLRLNKTKRALLKELELLIIDEVSMVRADMLDCVDAILRHFRHQPDLPFGGVQVLYIGDLFQLPPVTNPRDWTVLKEFYKSPFFFDSLAVQQAPPVYIELKKIYRQSDDRFIDVLNAIRNNSASGEDLELLNRHYQPQFLPRKEDQYITLTSHNAKADAINSRELQKLPGKMRSFEGTIKGEFNEKACPVERTLYLKEGAQIMFIKNDKGENRRFFNGKIGTVSRFTDDGIFVSFPGEAGELELETETWNNIRYSYNPEADKIDEEELGSYTQYPVRLAWAITIHKSQGLTFERAIIDAGEAFAAGQVYVALSRLTTLEGMVLYSRIQPHCIRTDERILSFAQSELPREELEALLLEEQKKFISHSLLTTFNLSKVVDTLDAHYASYDGRQIPDEEEAIAWAGTLMDKAKEQQEVALRFIQQLERLLQSAETDGFQHLYGRIEAAAAYFVKLFDETILPSVKTHAEQWKKKSRAKKYSNDLDTLRLILERKKMSIQHAVHLAKGLTQGLDAIALLQIVEEQRRKLQSTAAPEEKEKDTKEKVARGQTRVLSLELYRAGKTVQEIAAERNLTVSTIEGHLASYIESGDIAISEIVSEDRLPVIVKAIEESEPRTLGTIKSKLGSKYSYGEIKAVLSYLQVQD
ncbi:MAG TPA: helix-turn-helix domain-containing protein [Chitinophagaceae bacterium]|jgi:hypothetical protein|nr:helix-turn-helix domain-containing protein [Chitinophagaceae bacterium]